MNEQQIRAEWETLSPQDQRILMEVLRNRAAARQAESTAEQPPVELPADVENVHSQEENDAYTQQLAALNLTRENQTMQDDNTEPLSALPHDLYLSLAEQEDQLRKIDPEFDLLTFMADPMKRTMVLAGMPVAQVAAHFADIERRIRQATEFGVKQTIKQILNRNARPVSTAPNYAASAEYDLENASDEEILKIDARLKSGRPVPLP